MAIESIEISGLRGFANKQILKFALPNNKLGSGLTAIVGPNNGGKSTIVEALRTITASNVSFSEDKRNIQADYRLSIKAKDDSGNEIQLKTVDAGGSETEIVSSSDSQFKKDIFVLPSRRYFSPYFGKNEASRPDYINRTSSPSVRGGSIDQFSGRLFNINKNPAEFNKVLVNVLDPVPDWYIELAGSGQYFLKIKSGNSNHNSDGLGEGLVSLLFIIDALYDSLARQYNSN